MCFLRYRILLESTLCAFAALQNALGAEVGAHTRRVTHRWPGQMRPRAASRRTTPVQSTLRISIRLPFSALAGPIGHNTNTHRADVIIGAQPIRGRRIIKAINIRHRAPAKDPSSRAAL